MRLRKHVNYTLDIDDEIFPVPFDPVSDPEHTYIAANGLKAVLAFLVQDFDPLDPLDEFDEGEFYQFDRGLKHGASRPDIEDFKRLIRGNTGRVFTVDSCGDGYRAGELLTPKDCRGDERTGENSRAEKELDDADGYYIVPEDATDPLQYARGSIETYSQWCSGRVYGAVVWTYTRDSIADNWEDPERDECWGFYGRDGYTAEELERIFISESTPDEERTKIKQGGSTK